jgi:hypothetical protein
MVPQFTQGTFSQRRWPGIGAGPLDDCWIMADQQNVHACAPWETMRGVKPYREAAGVPDTATGSEGGSLEDSLKAIKALWPKIGAMVELYRGAWDAFEAKIKAGHSASGSVLSAALATKDGKAVPHRVSIYWDGSNWRVVNPLDEAHVKPRTMTEASVRKIFADYPNSNEVCALIFPTVEQAFTTHPLYRDPNAAADARLTTIKGKVAALAADVAND